MQIVALVATQDNLLPSPRHNQLPAMPQWPAPPSLRLSMAVPSSFPHDPPLSSAPHLQFELLPLRPTPHRPVPSPPPSTSPLPRPSSPHLWPALFAGQTPRGGIDVNQIPSSPLSEEAVADFTDLQEADPCGRVDTAIGSKREREKASEMDQDRTCEVSSRAGSDEDEGASTRKKLRLSKEQSALLEESFKEHSTLNPKQKNALAKQLSLRPRQVEVWFQNRRARTKLKQTEVDCELLKRCCQSLTEENRRLQKELKELRAIKVAAPCVFAHDFYMPLPAATLTMCPSCERLAAMDNRSLGFTKAQLPQFQQPSAAC